MRNEVEKQIMRRLENMSMKKCVITGGNAGIGKATAIELAKKNYEIVVFSRDSEKSNDAIRDIINQSGNENVRLVKVDLSETSSIKEACSQVNSEFSSLDLLINNAGVMKRRAFLNSKGIEHTFAVNYLAPFLISRLLLEQLRNASNGRLINVTSALYKKGKVAITQAAEVQKYNGNQAYADSKMLVLLDTMYLSRKYDDTNLSINCNHPGVVGTEVFREYPKWVAVLLNMMITKPEKAGHSLASLAADIERYPVSGKYFNISKPEPVRDLNGLLENYESLIPEIEEQVML